MNKYLIKHISKDLYLDILGYISKYDPYHTADYETKKQALKAYRDSNTSACCVIVERGKGCTARS